MKAPREQLLDTLCTHLAQPTVRLPQLSQRWARPHWVVNIGVVCRSRRAPGRAGSHSQGLTSLRAGSERHTHERECVCMYRGPVYDPFGMNFKCARGLETPFGGPLGRGESGRLFGEMRRRGMRPTCGATLRFRLWDVETCVARTGTASAQRSKYARRVCAP